VFLLRIQLERMRKGERVEVLEPLFPRYLFVNVKGCKQFDDSIRSTRGVSQLLHFEIEPLEVNSLLINDFKKLW
jgi:transcriptional antiterminator RfaH